MGHLPYLHFLCVCGYMAALCMSLCCSLVLCLCAAVCRLLACVLARPARLLAAYVPAVAAAGHSALCEHLSRRLSRYLAIAAAQYPPSIPLPPGY